MTTGPSLSASSWWQLIEREYEDTPELPAVDQELLLHGLWRARRDLALIAATDAWSYLRDSYDGLAREVAQDFEREPDVALAGESFEAYNEARRAEAAFHRANAEGYAKQAKELNDELSNRAHTSQITKKDARELRKQIELLEGLAQNELGIAKMCETAVMPDAHRLDRLAQAIEARYDEAIHSTLDQLMRPGLWFKLVPAVALVAVLVLGISIDFLVGGLTTVASPLVVAVLSALIALAVERLLIERFTTMALRPRYATLVVLGFLLTRSWITKQATPE